jgi:hypothetical protein
MEEQRSRYQVLGRMRVGELCKLLPWRNFASSIISQFKVCAWSPKNISKDSLYSKRERQESHYS